MIRKQTNSHQIAPHMYAAMLDSSFEEFRMISRDAVLSGQKLMLGQG